jgi:hypothetical protein
MSSHSASIGLEIWLNTVSIWKSKRTTLNFYILASIGFNVSASNIMETEMNILSLCMCIYIYVYIWDSHLLFFFFFNKSSSWKNRWLKY